MSPHTDAGALLKLADELRDYIEAVPTSPILAAMLKRAEPVVRQAASHGSAGGEAGWNATQRELEIRQLRIDNARLRDEAFLRSRDSAQASPVLCDIEHLKDYGENGYGNMTAGEAYKKGFAAGRAPSVPSAQSNSLHPEQQRIADDLNGRQSASRGTEA